MKLNTPQAISFVLLLWSRPWCYPAAHQSDLISRPFTYPLLLRQRSQLANFVVAAYRPEDPR